MFFVHLIEIDATVVGIVAQEGKAYRFYAVKSFFRQLEGRVFDNAESARIAALELSPLYLRPSSALIRVERFDDGIPRQWPTLVFDNA
jgi:hypothetical protein